MANPMGPGLVVYNTLTRRKEPFVPLAPPHVGMYVCGLTVYDYAHIGHARTAVAFETIRRWLAHRGYDVTFVQNVTDVDDKIINRARELNVDPQEHAATWTRICNDDMARLGVSPPDVQPKVTEHIPHIIRLTQRLLERGMAYVAPDGSVYYRVAKKKDYGKLSNRSPEDLLAGARVEPAEGKEDPRDFALWKAAKPNERPQWPATFQGRTVAGRPGWHIECSAMSLAYLGERFDIHGGGVDLVFPHHENEVAQSEGATGAEPFVKYWLHTGFLTVDGEKMSKSLKNFIAIHELLTTTDPEVMRFFYANTHYRSGIDYSRAAVEDAGRGLERLRRLREELDAVAAAGRGEQKADAMLVAAARRLEDRFHEAMDDDFNTREAVAALFEFLNAANKALTDGVSSSAAQLGAAQLRRHARILTILEPATAAADAAKAAQSVPASLVDALLETRALAREAKQFQISDRIRDALQAAGVEVQDTKGGAKVRAKT